LVSILLLSAATSKLSLLPLCAILLFLSAWPLLRSAPSAIAFQLVAATASPWIVFYLPITLWTWAQSGSPFGPVLAGVFGSSIYSLRWLEQIFRLTRELTQSAVVAVQHTVLGYSPLIWLAVIGAILCTDLSKATRLALIGLLALQCILIYTLLPYDARYLGGFHYGLLIAFASFATPAIQDRLDSSRSVTAMCAIFLLPWLGIQIYFAKQFFPVSLGLETESAFLQRYVAFYADYVKLDRLLSKDTVLLASDRLSAVYAPRAIFFDAADIPPGKQTALFAPPDKMRNVRALGGVTLGDPIYENPQAVSATFRTPGRAAVIAPLQVLKFMRD
jgi:hypothetical protein